MVKDTLGHVFDNWVFCLHELNAYDLRIRKDHPFCNHWSHKPCKCKIVIIRCKAQALMR